MATVYTTTESKLEEAWAGYLAKADGLSTTSVFAFGKGLDDATYPCVSIRALGSESSAKDLRVEQFDVEINCYTEALPDKDSDCSELYGIVAAIRSAIVTSGAKDILSAEVDGLAVKAITKYVVEYVQLVPADADTLLDKRYARIVVSQLAVSYDQTLST